MPLHRLTKVVEEREAAKAEAAAVRKELESAKSAAAELATVRAELDAAKATAAKAAESWRTERVLLEAGLTDPEAREVATLLYGRLPVEERPSFETWVGGLRADPSKAPKSLQAWMGGAVAPASTVPPRAGGTQTAPTQPRPAEVVSTAGASTTAEQLRAAGERARREGTQEARDAYNALREKTLAETRGS